MEQQHKCAKCGSNTVKLYRFYGSFLRDDEIFCGAHKPNNNGWYVPLCEDVDGSVWVYTSVPEDALQRFNALPD